MRKRRKKKEPELPSPSIIIRVMHSEHLMSTYKITEPTYPESSIFICKNTCDQKSLSFTCHAMPSLSKDSPQMSLMKSQISSEIRVILFECYSGKIVSFGWCRHILLFLQSLPWLLSMGFSFRKGRVWVIIEVISTAGITDLKGVWNSFKIYKKKSRKGEKILKGQNKRVVLFYRLL